MEKKKLSQSEIDGVQYRRAKTWHIALSQINGGSSMAFYILIGMISYLANEGYGIAVAVAGFILTATRIFDGIIDPVLAILIDKTNTKHGKLRILMFIGWVIRAFAALLLFVWGSGKGHGIFMFVIMYMLYIVGSSLVDISANIIGPVMSNDPKQRPLINVWGTVYNYLFPMIFSLVTTLVILPKHGNKYSVDMLAETCILYVIVSLVLLLISFIGIAPIDKPENFKGIHSGEEQQVKVHDMLKFLKGNKPFQLYLIAAASEKLAQQTGGQAVVTTMLFGILIGNIQFGSILSMVAMLPAIVFAIIGGRYAGKHGGKNSILTWTRVCIAIAGISIVFCSVIDMRQIPSNIVLMVIFFALLLSLNGARMCVTTASGAMRADIIDYELDRSGKYMPAIVVSTYNFIDQIITSFGATIAAGCVALIGFKSVMPQPTDEPSKGIFIVTMFLYYGLPMLAWLCTQIVMRFYKLSKEEMVNVQKRIHDQKMIAVTKEND
jgi:Na+/melibiose symporter-like transporter